ncbi:MAG TPA: amidohydrolase family protein [Planctomycetota bacterium]|nr:amidohydrolase family protein [Planctomycetota bacterium]
MNTRTYINPDSPLAAEFWEHGKAASCPVYDMHGHMGVWHSIYFPRAEAAEMAKSMDAAGVRLLCFAHHASLFAPDIGNAAAVQAVRAFPDHFRAYLSVNPHYPELLSRDLAEFDSLRDVYVGLKFLADYHGVPISDDRYRGAWEFANDRGLPVLSHTWGGSPCNGASEIRKIATRYSRIKLFLGHSLNNRWSEAVDLAREFPHVYLELTSVLGRRGVLEFFCEKVGSHRLLYGTDLPWFDEHQSVGSVLAAEITEEDRHNILHRNAEKLLEEENERRTPNVER